MLNAKGKASRFRSARYPASRRAVLGVDGGGTKTHAIILDLNLNILGEGVAGPSNPLRVGVVSAATAIREAIDKACDAAGLRRTDLLAAEIGLAGVRRHELRARMHESLKGLGIATWSSSVIPTLHSMPPRRARPAWL